MRISSEAIVMFDEVVTGPLKHFGRELSHDGDLVAFVTKKLQTIVFISGP